MTNKTAHAVIGASYGDEGKGLTTDFLCSVVGTPVTVVRFNGGSQAGHTVQNPTGLRHVCHHFSSGSLIGARTYLSQHFICNPILFAEERTKLLTKGVPEVAVMADPRCLVTTPWDMMLNRLVEVRRGLKRHGSCGLGINETVTRNAETTFGFSLVKVNDNFKPFLQAIQHEYVPYRINQLGLSLDELSGGEKENLFSEGVCDHYFEDLCKFVANVKVLPLDALHHDNIIFEGAQGLGLDEKRGVFPYVTRSNTGLQNVIGLCQELEIETLKTVYVTRPYITRHGEGPLAHELRAAPWKSVVDTTNIPNKWQGMLRFGLIDEDSLADRITLDLAEARYQAQTSLQIDPSIMMTCVDQIPGSLDKGQITYFSQNHKSIKSVPNFLIMLRQHIGASSADKCWVSLGPSRDNVLPLISSRATV